MPGNFNCPNCGATNPYSGVGDTVHCAYCGSDVRVPQEMVSRAAVTKFSSQARIWIILFIVVVFVIPTCATVGGTLISFIAALVATFVGIFAGN